MSTSHRHNKNGGSKPPPYVHIEFLNMLFQLYPQLLNSAALQAGDLHLGDL